MSTKPVIPNKRTVLESIRTLVGIENQITRELGLPYTMKENTTLNELLRIQEGVAPPSTVYPTIKYMCIGSGGVSMQNCDGRGDTFPFPRVYQHRSDDTGLFRMIPFVMRELNNDLTPEERAKYALRRIEEDKGVRYYAYYLKRMDLTQTRVESKIITANEGTTDTVEDYIPTRSNLNPVPQELSVEEENVLKSKYGKVVATIHEGITREDVEELYNVFNILRGSPMEAVITEIGLVSGVDLMVEVPTSITTGGRDLFNEAIAAQIVYINRTLQYLGSNSGGFTTPFTIGANEPIFNIRQETVGGRAGNTVGGTAVGSP